jgi:hypothetical protein
MWGDVDASTFRVRSRTYCIDKVKTTSAPSIFKLIAIDVFETAEPTSHIAAHPKNRVALAHQRGEKTWVFIVNIMVPGPPHYSFVVYMEGDKVYLTVTITITGIVIGIVTATVSVIITIVITCMVTATVRLFGSVS